MHHVPGIAASWDPGHEPMPNDGKTTNHLQVKGNEITNLVVWWYLRHYRFIQLLVILQLPIVVWLIINFGVFAITSPFLNYSIEGLLLQTITAREYAYDTILLDTDKNNQ